MKLKWLIREVKRSPGINLTIILLSAIGIGSSTAIFAIMRPVLLKPLPFPAANQIVTIWGSAPGMAQMQVSPPDLQDLRARTHSLGELASYRYWSATISGGRPAEQLHAARVSPEFFRVLGVHPFSGREFTAQEFTDHQVVIVGYQLWQRWLKEGSGTGNGYIKLNGTLYGVVGVMPRGFDFPAGRGATEVWAPLAMTPLDLVNRNAHDLQVIGRLRDGMRLEGAETEISALSAQIAREHPETNSAISLKVNLLQAELNAGYRSGLWLLMGASVLILLIACANNSGLLLAKGSKQHRGIVIRKTLGASNMQIMRESLYESLFLSVSGAILGMVLAYLCLAGVRSLVQNMPSSGQIQIDPVVVTFAILVSTVSGALFGVVPALQSARVEDLSAALRGGVGLRTWQARRAQAVLMVFETTLAFVLLVTAGLLVRTVIGLWSVPLGFNSEHVLTTNFTLPQSRYPAAGQQIQFFRAATENIRRLPQVKGLALASPLPWHGEIGVDYAVGGEESPPGGRQADLTVCSASLLAVLEVPLLRGRVFAEGSAKGPVHEAVINQSMAKRFGAHEDALGKIIDIEGIGKAEIVGIAADFRQTDFVEPTQPAIFVSYELSPTPYMGLLARYDGNAAATWEMIRSEIGKIDPDLAPKPFQTMKETLQQSLEQRFFVMALLLVFSSIALVLLLVGSYGFIARLVTQRRREFAVRVAVGATTRSLFSLVLGRGLFLTTLGSILGAIGSIVITKLVSNLLWGIKPTDPLTYGLALVVLFSANMAAFFRPAMEALRISPAELLREE
jgi:putative ABC transport system permease protein